MKGNAEKRDERAKLNKCPRVMIIAIILFTFKNIINSHTNSMIKMELRSFSLQLSTQHMQHNYCFLGMGRMVWNRTNVLWGHYFLMFFLVLCGCEELLLNSFIGFKFYDLFIIFVFFVLWAPNF